MSLRHGLGQQQVLRQDLRINPRLYQAMDLLYMPLLDLQQHLKQELLQNPFLELLEPSEEEPEVATPVEERAKAEEAKEKEQTNWEDILLDGFRGDGGGYREEREEQEYREPVTVQQHGLADYLRDQLQLQNLDQRQMLLAEAFVGNIADDGYLTTGVEENVAGANAMLEEFAVDRPHAKPVAPYTAAEGEELLRVLQSLDPPGIAARDLRECLMLQLREQGEQDSLEYRLLS